MANASLAGPFSPTNDTAVEPRNGQSQTNATGRYLGALVLAGTRPEIDVALDSVPVDLGQLVAREAEIR
jgi:hypothetical protein